MTIHTAAGNMRLYDFSFYQFTLSAENKREKFITAMKNDWNKVFSFEANRIRNVLRGPSTQLRMTQSSQRHCRYRDTTNTTIVINGYLN
jgi:hypothetical protein